jgi:hypothetical protein
VNILKQIEANILKQIEANEANTRGVRKYETSDIKLIRSRFASIHFEANIIFMRIRHTVITTVLYSTCKWSQEIK